MMSPRLETHRFSIWPIVLIKSATGRVGFGSRFLEPGTGGDVSRSLDEGQHWRPQHGELPEVLGGRCQVELVSSAVRSA